MRRKQLFGFKILGLFQTTGRGQAFGESSVRKYSIRGAGKKWFLKASTWGRCICWGNKNSRTGSESSTRYSTELACHTVPRNGCSPPPLQEAGPAELSGSQLTSIRSQHCLPCGCRGRGGMGSIQEGRTGAAGRGGVGLRAGRLSAAP